MGARILVVEDEPDIMRIITHALQSAGHTVIPAYGGEDAIRKVLTGEIFLSDKMKAKLLQQLANGRGKTITSPIEHLTDRELEVFRLIGEGRSTRQIAAELHLSVRTVEAYREYIKGKLNLKNSTELVQHAFHWVHQEAAARP